MKGGAELWSQEFNTTARRKGRLQFYCKKPYHKIALTISDFSTEDLGNYTVRVWNSVRPTTVTHEIHGQSYQLHRDRLRRFMRVYLQSRREVRSH